MKRLIVKAQRDRRLNKKHSQLLIDLALVFSLRRQMEKMVLSVCFGDGSALDVISSTP